MLNTTHSLGRFLPGIPSLHSVSHSISKYLYSDIAIDLDLNHKAGLTRSNPQSTLATKPDPTPQVYATEDGKISLVLPAPKIKNIEFPGGGASAIVIPFALASLNEEVLDGVEHFAGCSGGGLVASLIASGMKPAALNEKLEKNPIANYLGPVPYFEELYPGVACIPAKSDLNLWHLTAHLSRMILMTLFLGNWQRTAQGIMQLLDKWSSQAVSMHLQDAAIWDTCIAAHTTGRITDQQMGRLTFLKNSPWFCEPSASHTSRIKHMITFGDLKLLQSIAPSKFKELTLVSSHMAAAQDDAAHSTTHVTPTVFNAVNHPDMPIAIAARASMSIPFYFEFLSQSGAAYSDGAMTNRIPTESFHSADASNDPLAAANAYAQTLVLDFKSHSFGDTLSPVLYKKPANGPDKSLLSKAIEWFLGYPGYAAAVGDDNRKLYAAGPNAVVIDNDRIGVFDMRPSTTKFKAAQKAAVQTMQQQVELRKNQAYYLPFDNVVSAWNALDGTQKEAVKAAGNPALHPDFKKLPANTQYAQYAFYVLATANTSGEIERKTEIASVLDSTTKRVNAPTELVNPLPTLQMNITLLSSLTISLKALASSNTAFIKNFFSSWRRTTVE